ncbi:hypothetical protein QYM36_009329 [Artemia franciscana]|uniref:Uncharacterized protein n=1 Tax=Artemia franciscana TaxID=6661 RepID=A0AA88I191_ARTSF|nr:hypothetical protein QYM36_009329 [Artemia franciscana]
MEAPAWLLPVVQTQLDQVAEFFARLQHYHDHLEETRHASEKLTKQGRDIQSSTDQIATMEKNILKLEERSKAHNDELERVLWKLESFYGLLDQVSIDIEDASNKEVKFKAVSVDVNVIRQQQAEFNELCEKLRNSLEETVLEPNKTSQGFVQSAGPGVTTTKLEEHIKQLRNSADFLEELLSWLTKQENTLVDRDAEPLPDDIPTVEELIKEHNQLMEETAARTPEVDRVCKPKQ